MLAGIMTGMNWLVENIGIDGVYIDDLAFDRTTMKRLRKGVAPAYSIV